MKEAKWILALVLAGVLVPAVWGQQTDDQAREHARSPKRSAAPSSSSSQEGNTASVKAGTKISAELMSAVDAQTAKPGDEVVARVTKNVKQHGRTVIRKGDRLVGRITSVDAGATAKAGSQLGVTFDRLVQGSAVSNLNAVINSVVSSPAQSPQPMSMPEPEMAPMPSGGGGGGSAGGGGGLVGGAVSLVGSVVGGTVDSAAGAAGSTLGGVGGTVDATTRSTAASSAGAGLATPLAAIHVNSAAQADNQNHFGSVLSTRHGNLHLDSGTRLQFRVSSQAEVQRPKK